MDEIDTDEARHVNFEEFASWVSARPSRKTRSFKK